MKSVMNEWEELNKIVKDEKIEFGKDKAGDVGVLGSWVSAGAKVGKMIKCVNGL